MAADRTWIPYCGAAPAPADLLGRWNLDPPLLAALLIVAAVLYKLGGRDGPIVPAAATALLGLLFVSPFCALTSALFAARVAHHVMLVAFVAPLLAMSLPRRWTLVPRSLAFWTATQAFLFWIWHSPAVYAVALSSHAVYWLMQLSMLGSAVAFWLAVLRAPALQSVAALLATMVQMGLLGALITFSANPLYEPHFNSSWSWGFSPLEDQQLGGLIMWAPSAGVYLAAALGIAARWLRAESRATAR